MVEQFKVSDDLEKQQLTYRCMELYLKKWNSSCLLIWMTTS